VSTYTHTHTHTHTHTYTHTHTHAHAHPSIAKTWENVRTDHADVKEVSV